MQGVENDARRIFGSNQQIETGKRAVQESIGGSVDGITGWVDGVDGPRSGGDGVDERAFLAGQKKLHAVIQLVIQRDFRDGRLDRDLALRPVELADGLLDDALRFLVGIDQYGVVGDIGRNPDILQNTATGRLGSGPQDVA